MCCYEVDFIMKVNTPKTILILGNGFDLAHGLPTRYSDFLEFAKRVMFIYTCLSNVTEDQFYKDNIDSWGKNEFTNTARNMLKEKLADLFKNRKTNDIQSPDNPSFFIPDVHVNARLDIFYEYLKDNIWYNYILPLYISNQIKGENWIDFESEIAFIIKIIDNAHDSLSQFLDDMEDKHLDPARIDTEIRDKMKQFKKACAVCFHDDSFNFYKKMTVRELRTKLYDDLEKLILAFEIYLTDFVENIPVTSKISSIEAINPDYVISFNYTKTYEEHYIKANQRIKICYIHGVCNKNGNPDNNNMVLGIDEYLTEDKRAEQVDFCIFKKFVQRIRKHNDVSYATWYEEIENARGAMRFGTGAVVNGRVSGSISDIYICGHSLNVTDKDILRRFLISTKTCIHVFARDKASEGELIANLIRVTNEDIIVRKSTANPPMIEFLPLA